MGHKRGMTAPSTSTWNWTNRIPKWSRLPSQIWVHSNQCRIYNRILKINRRGPTSKFSPIKSWFHRSKMRSHRSRANPLRPLATWASPGLKQRIHSPTASWASTRATTSRMRSTKWKISPWLASHWIELRKRSQNLNCKTWRRISTWTNS